MDKIYEFTTEFDPVLLFSLGNLKRIYLLNFIPFFLFCILIFIPNSSQFNDLSFYYIDTFSPSILFSTRKFKIEIFVSKQLKL